MRAIADMVGTLVEVNAQHDAERMAEQNLAFEIPFCKVLNDNFLVMPLVSVLHAVHGLVGSVEERIVGHTFRGQSHAHAEGQTAIGIFLAQRFRMAWKRV